MTRLKKTIVVLAVLLSLSISLVGQPVSAALPSVSLDKELMYPVFLRVLGYIRGYYVDDVPVDALLRGAINGMLSSLDAYSVYYGKQEYADFIDSTISGAFGGIGVHIDVKDGYVTVVAPIPGTPAEAAGLGPGDRILEVDGRSAKGWSTDTASSFIRGQPGTKVRIKIQKPSGQIQDLGILRAIIKLESVQVRVAEKGAIGIIRLLRFTDGTASEFGVVMSTLKDRGVKAVLLDLRDNPGGLLSSAIDILGYLIPKGPAVHIIDRTGKTTTYDSGTDDKILPMVVMINGGSASASEIVAGAIKDRASGFLIGQTSFGKGSVQTIIDLPNGEGLKLTTHRYVTPNKNKIDGIGVEPDMKLGEASWPDASKAPPVTSGRQYRLGDGGADVLQIGRAMIALGYLKSPQSSYSEALLTAVGKYQVAKGLKVTGIVDADTSSAINSDLLYQGLGGTDRWTWEAIQILKQKARIGF